MVRKARLQPLQKNSLILCYNIKIMYTDDEIIKTDVPVVITLFENTQGYIVRRQIKTNKLKQLRVVCLILHFHARIYPPGAT